MTFIFTTMLNNMKTTLKMELKVVFYIQKMKFVTFQDN